MRKCDNQGGTCVEFDDTAEGVYFERTGIWATEDGPERGTDCMWLCPVCVSSPEGVELDCWPWEVKRDDTPSDYTLKV